MALFERAAKRFGDAPDGLLQLVQGGREVGEALVDHRPRAAGLGHRLDRHGPRGRTAARAALRPVAARARRQQCHHRLPVGRPRPCARGRPFAAVGTAGQRCTTLRRLFVHESVSDRLVERLRAPFGKQWSAIRARQARWSAR